MPNQEDLYEVCRWILSEVAAEKQVVKSSCISYYSAAYKNMIRAAKSGGEQAVSSSLPDSRNVTLNIWHRSLSDIDNTLHEIDEAVQNAEEADNDYVISRYCVQHIYQDILLLLLRNYTVRPWPSELKVGLADLNESSAGLAAASREEQVTRTLSIQKVTKAVLEDHLVWSMENAFSALRKGRGRHELQLRHDAELKCLLEACTQFMEDLVAENYPIIGVFTAVVDYHFAVSISPATLIQQMADA